MTDPTELNRQAAARARLVAVFHLLTALNSAAYICYVVAFVRVVGLLENFQSGLAPWMPASAEELAFLILGASLLCEALFEIPAGRLADKLGFAWSVRSSFAWLAAHASLYMVVAVLLASTEAGSGVWQQGVSLGAIGASELMLAWGTALATGAFTSWFVSSMKREGFAGPLTQHMARRRLTTNVTWAVFGAVGLIGFEIHPALPFILSFVAYVTAFVVARSITSVQVDGVNTPAMVERRAVFAELRATLRHPLREIAPATREILAKPLLLTVFVTHTTFWTLGLALVYFFSRPFEEFSLSFSGLSVDETLGAVWVMIAVARIAGSETVNRLTRRGEGFRLATFLLGQLLMGASMAFAAQAVEHGAWQGAAGLAILIAVSRFGQELSKPIALAWIHEQVSGDDNRATIESMVEGAASTGMFLAYLLSFGGSSVPQIFSVLGFAVLIFNVPAIGLYARARARSLSKT